MKFIYFVAAFAVALSTVSCKKETVEEIKETVADNEITGLNLAKSISGEGLIIEVYTQTGTFKTGYNDVYYRVKESATNKYILTADLSVNAEMDMTSTAHGTPATSVKKLFDRPNMYRGAIIFTMASTETEAWTLTVNVTEGSTTRSVTDGVNVTQASKRDLNVFVGLDGYRYVLAMIKPLAPKVGINDITAVLYQRIDDYTYALVNNYRINFDPRMPSMGNHSSPNNVQLTPNSTGDFYSGKLNLTMTGLWKINLMVYNLYNELLKGEEITEEHESSSIYFEVEF